MRIVIVHHHHLPRIGESVTGEGLRVQQLILGLESHGHEIESLSFASLSSAELRVCTARNNPDIIIVMQAFLVPSLAQIGIPIVLDLYAQRLMEAQFEANTMETSMELIAALRLSSLVLVSNDRQRWSWQGVLSLLGARIFPPPIVVVPLSVRVSIPRDPPTSFRLIGGGMSWPWQNPWPALERTLTYFDTRGEGEIIWFGAAEKKIEHPRLRYMKRVSHHAFRRQLLCSSAAFDWMEQNIEREFAVAFRHMDFIGCGLPILTGSYSPLSTVFKKGCWIQDDIESVLEEIMDQPALLTEASLHILEHAESLSAEKTVLVLHQRLQGFDPIEWSESPLSVPASLWVQHAEQKEETAVLRYANDAYQRDINKKEEEITALQAEVHTHVRTIAEVSKSMSDVVAYRKEAMIVLGGHIAQKTQSAEGLTSENAILRADIAKKSAELEAMNLLRARLENDIQVLREENLKIKKRGLWGR
jgi:hypothetical protein